MNCTSMVNEYVKKYPPLKIIEAGKIYRKDFKHTSEQAFYKAFSRMENNGEIHRLTKGVYCVPKKGKYGIIAAGEENILEHYLGTNEKKGVVVGYRMYNKYRITTQVSKRIIIYSNAVLQNTMRIENVVIKKAGIPFGVSTNKIIELLEVLQNYRAIEELNYFNMMKFIESAVKYYNEKKLRKIISHIGYKKSTLASLKNVLDYFGVKNTVDLYLNKISKYDAFKIGERYEATFE